jgi:monolysocardiolipin acyltransferase
LRQMWNKKVMRWGLAAQDFCFTEKSHARFFLYGQGIPVVRGGGVYQPAIDMCIEKLSRGDWVHVFPEGKVNETKEPIRLKWGVGRMIHELPQIPMVIPIWHIGMDKVFSNTPPCVLKMGQKVTLNIGQPIDLIETIRRVKELRLDEVEARKCITDKIQDALYVSLSQCIRSIFCEDLLLFLGFAGTNDEIASRIMVTMTPFAMHFRDLKRAIH